VKPASAPLFRRKTNLNLLELFLIVLALLFLYPIYIMIASSFYSEGAASAVLPIPNLTNWEKYGMILADAQFYRSLFNSIVVTCSTIGIAVVVTSMAGYAISRQGKGILNWILLLFLSGLIIPLQTTMIPQFKLALLLDLMNTKTFLVLLYTAGIIPFATFIYVGFTKTVSREIEESAMLDGCGKFRTFWSIVFPLLAPATGTVIVTNMFGIWNDFINPLIYLQDTNKMTAITYIYNFKQKYSTDWGAVFAVCTLISVPLLIVFGVVQKRLFQSVAAGALKG